VGPRRHEIELVRAPARQGLVRPPWGESQVGEKRWNDDVGVRPTDDKRVARRCHFYDPGAGPSYAPSTEAGGEFKDIHCLLEVVLQGVPEGMWSHILDEGILE
jgi:hypothetical protein